MRLAIAIAMTLAACLPANADACRERFIDLFTNRNATVPVKIHVTQEIKGGMTTKNYNYQNGPDHWMTEMIEPSNMAWSLVYDNAMFTSSDRGATWQKIRTLDSAHNSADNDKNLRDAAATAKDAVCGTEDIDGISHETVEASYEYVKYKTAHRDKYWVNPKTGWIAKSTTLTKQAGFESFVTQIIEPAPGLDLPKPR